MKFNKMKIKSNLSFVLILFTLLSNLLHAQSDGNEWEFLGATEGSAPGTYGLVSKMNNDGSIYIASESTYNSGSGKVNTYKYMGDYVWQQLGQEIIGDVNSNTGYSVDINADGTIIAVGSVFFESYSGYVKIYKYDAGSWVQLGQTLDGGEGYSVSLNAEGNRVSITDYNFDGSSSLKVKVYDLNGNTWEQIGTEINFSSATGRKGVNLSADGNSLAILSDNVFVYRFNGTDWDAKGQTFNSSDFGTGAAIASLTIDEDGERIAFSVGTSNIGSISYVYSYEFHQTSNTWIQLGEPLEYSTTLKDVSLSSDGSRMAVGDNYENEWMGQVFVYDYNENLGSWEQVGDTLIGGLPYTHFGISIDICGDGSRISVGALPEGNFGNFYIFEYTGDTMSATNAQLTSLTYYPNPVKDILTVQTEKKIESISIYNLTGQKVIADVNIINSKINLSSLTVGSYVVQVTLENGQIETFKILKK